MNQAKKPDVKKLENGKLGAIPRLADGKAGPARLITAGEKAQLKADEAEEAVRKLFPPPPPGKTEEKDGEKGKPSGWTLVVGHAF